MKWAAYSYVRLTVRLGGKNDVKTYRFDSKEDVDLLEADMNLLIASMRATLEEEPKIALH